MALVLVAALGATAIGRLHPRGGADLADLAVGGLSGGRGGVGAGGLRAGRLRPPAAAADGVSSRMGRRSHRDAHRRARAVSASSRARWSTAFAGAVFVQATMVLFYFAVAYALHLDIAFWDLAVIVPISFVVQMLPVSVNGFGVREATFSFYFHRIGQPIEAAILLSLVAQALLMLFSLSGPPSTSGASATRRRRRSHERATETQRHRVFLTTEPQGHRDPERTLQIPMRRTPPSAAARLEEWREHKRGTTSLAFPTFFDSACRPANAGRRATRSAQCLGVSVVAF